MWEEFYFFFKIANVICSSKHLTSAIHLWSCLYANIHFAMGKILICKNKMKTKTKPTTEQVQYTYTYTGETNNFSLHNEQLRVPIWK